MLAAAVNAFIEQCNNAGLTQYIYNLLHRHRTIQRCFHVVSDHEEPIGSFCAFCYRKILYDGCGSSELNIGYGLTVMLMTPADIIII